jgi:hypothetical protein
VSTSSRIALAISLLTLAACTPGGNGAKPSSLPSASLNAASCRLPVVIRSFDRPSATWSPDATGFLTYPGGIFTAANARGVRYDARRHRWLPAGVPTPDGSGYVYATDTAVHRVWLDTGRDETIVSGSWWALGFVGDQLYLGEVAPVTISLEGVPGSQASSTIRGVARTSASGGNPVFVTHQGLWSISSLGGWSFDRADGMMQAPDRVLHLDLNTGVVEPWLTGVPGAMLSGFDAQGRPFVFNYGDAVRDGYTKRVVRLMSKGDARVVLVGSYEAPRPEPPYYVDGERVWFSGFGITEPTQEAPAFLYETGAGLRPSIGVPGAQVTVAGPCTNG